MPALHSVMDHRHRRRHDHPRGPPLRTPTVAHTLDPVPWYQPIQTFLVGPPLPRGIEEFLVLLPHRLRWDRCIGGGGAKRGLHSSSSGDTKIEIDKSIRVVNTTLVNPAIRRARPSNHGSVVVVGCGDGQAPVRMDVVQHHAQGGVCVLVGWFTTMSLAAGPQHTGCQSLQGPAFRDQV